MRGVVQNGSGKLADLEGYEVGGKTGTAEKLPRSEGKNLVSFIGYAPQENPEIAIYVVIDEPNEYDQAQSSLAVQMASDIMKEIFPYLGISKTSETATIRQRNNMNNLTKAVIKYKKAFVGFFCA
mgnify:CR=1 FL=1